MLVGNLVCPIPFREEHKTEDFMGEGSGENGFKEKVTGCWRKSV
jgi:hypothetical protein